MADVAVAGFDQPALISEGDCLSAVREPEFGEDGRDVGLDGCGPDEQFFGDLDIARPSGDGDEDLPLATGESVETRHDR